MREYRDLREELTIMSHLSHPCVVTLLGVCLKPLCVVMPLAAQVTLGGVARGTACSGDL